MTLIQPPVESGDTERALARYRLLAEHASDIMFFVRADGRIAEANEAAVRAYGYSREELLGLTVFQLRLPDDQLTAAAQLARAAAGSATFETVHLRKDGSTFPVEVSSQSADTGGERLLFSVVRDVSERKRAELALRESEERFRRIANAAPALVWLSDEENRCTWFNEPWTAFTGRSLAQELGDGWLAGVHPDDRERYTRADREAFERRESFAQEFRLRRHDGEYRWILEHGRPMWTPDGRFTGFAGTCVDITERKRLELRQALLLEISRLVLETPEAGPALTEAIFEKIRGPLDADVCFNYRVVEGELRLEACVGVPEPLRLTAGRLRIRQAFCGTVADTCRPIMADARRIREDPKGAFVREVAATAYACHPLFDSHGRVLGTFSVASRTRDSFDADDLHFLQTICHFVAVAWERQAANAALARNEEQLRLALAASRAGIWSWDIATGAVTWSPESYELFGYDPAAGPLTYADFERRVHPDDLGRTAQALRDAVEGRVAECRVEFRVVHPVRGVRWILGVGRLERSADGTARRLSGINLDLTERRETEARLHQAQRVQSVGRLAGGIAHEVNNLMTVVLGFGNFALEQLEPGHAARGEVEQMIRAGERAATITRQLLAFTRQQVLRPARLDINTVVRDLAPMLERVLGAEHRLGLDLGAGLGAVAVDQAQLEQVLVNLTLNSRDAMTTPGTVTISTGTAELVADAAWRHPGTELRPGRYLQLSVTDTGAGMDEATRSRVFEPFFTTKPVGQGTGLGLSTVYGIVKQSGGYVWLYSEPGQGTCARVYLPMTGAAEAAAEDATATRSGTARGEVILVAEDEPLVRSLARRSLELQGYRVLEAGNGREALEMLERVGPVDLIVSDAVMPLLSGRALGEVVAARWPGIPVLYTSGYPGREVVDRGLVHPDAPFLAKPFTPEALARRVREVLDRVRA